MVEPVRHAVVGVGAVGHLHARHLAESPVFDLVALVDTDENQASRIADRHDCPWFTDVSDLVQFEDLEAVTVATPPATHLEVGLACLDRGWHVLMEKPMDVSTERARRLVKHAKECGRVLAVGHQYRNHQWAKEVKSLIDSGTIGDPLHVIWYLAEFRSEQYYENTPWKAYPDSGLPSIVINQASHDLDLLVWMLGKPVSVSADGALQVHAKGYLDSTAIQIRFESGCLATLVWSLNTPRSTSFRRFVGTSGVISMPHVLATSFDHDDLIRIGRFEADARESTHHKVPDRQPAVKWNQTRTERMARYVARRARRKLGRVKKDPAREPQRLMIEQFGRAVRGLDQPLVSGNDGLVVVKLLDAIVRSISDSVTVQCQ